MKKNCPKFIPYSLKPIVKKLYFFPIDVIDWLKGRNSMIPPRSKISISIGDCGAYAFERIGLEFKDYFIDLANLQPNNLVLDVGCGIGRMAIPLTNYLSQEGVYWGFDVGKKGVKWCQNNISPKFSNFHFFHSDVYNKCYNRNGKVRAQDFQFPFNDDFFDFVFLTSVFTHMLPSDVENYLSEISRVLKTGGKCLFTFYLLNEESEKLIHSGCSTLDFRYKIQSCLTVNENAPEDNIAYNEEFVKILFEKYRLKIIQPIRYGHWCKRDSFFSYQDLIIAIKHHSN